MDHHTHHALRLLRLSLLVALILGALHIDTPPSYATAARLIDDPTFLSAPGFDSLALQTFLEQHPGPLKRYQATLDGKPESAATVISVASMGQPTEVNPQVLVVLLELAAGLITTARPDTSTLQRPFELAAQSPPSFEADLFAMGNMLHQQFNTFDPTNAPQIRLRDGSVYKCPPPPNAGTYALEGALGSIAPDQRAFARFIGDGAGSFRTTFARLFGAVLPPTPAPIPSPLQSAPLFLSKPFVGNFAAGSFLDHNRNAGPFLRFDGTSSGGYDQHTGTDYPMSSRQTVLAAADGTVADVAINRTEGNPGQWCSVPYTPVTGMVISHTVNGITYKTWYWHLSAGAIGTNPRTNQQYRIGDTISRGETVGFSGSTGCATGPHLHFEVQTGGHSTDPYGWCGASADPYPYPNAVLWADAMTNPSPCPSPATLVNPSFEDSSGAYPWVWSDPCNRAIYENAAIANHGTRYLATNRNNNPACLSFYQDVGHIPQPGVTYRFAIRIRSANTLPHDGVISLWGLGGQQESAPISFSVRDQEWLCYETVLHVQNGGHNALRAEVYLNSFTEGDYLFDNAVLQEGGGPLCPGPATLIDPSFEDSMSAEPWVGDGPCNRAVYENAAIADHGTRYFATNRNNDPACVAFHQDVGHIPRQGATYRFAIRIRSSNTIPHDGTVVLWGLGGQQENAVVSFSVRDQEWLCYETVLHVQNGGHNLLRAQVYLSSFSAGDYLFDNAVLQEGGGPLCPAYQGTFVAQNYQNTMIVGATQQAQIQVKNTGTATWDTLTRLTIARGGNSPFADPSWISSNRIMSAPPVVPGAVATFDFVLRAPSITGQYTIEFGLIQEGVTTFTKPAEGAIQFVMTIAPAVGDGSSRQQMFVNAFNRVGGIPTMGYPRYWAHWSGTTNDQSVVIQEFTGGSGDNDAVIIHDELRDTPINSTPAYVVRGGILNYYLSLGGWQSWLGPPTSDEFINAAGQPQSNFRSGSISWNNGHPVAIAWPAANDQWQAEYHNGRNLNNYPTWVQNEATLTHEWGVQAPGLDHWGVSADNFSVRWTRSIPLDAGDYTFVVRADDGVRVWVDAVLIIDQWHDQTGTAYRATLPLQRGDHNLKVEYFETAADAQITFSWTRAPSKAFLPLLRR